MSEDLLLTFNAGSSSLKIGLFEIASPTPKRIAAGTIDLSKIPLNLRFEEAKGSSDLELCLLATDQDDITKAVFEWVETHFERGRVTAVGHRVVHGGDRFKGPARIDDDTLQAIEDLTRLAPLHQPQSVSFIKAVRQLKPELVQSASFDTAFHRTNADLVRRFAISRSLHNEGIKRYGFHGLSYKYIAADLARQYPVIARGRVVAAHLGSGASLCGLKNGESRDSSMGFSTLDGIPMATRCGALDPGVLLHLLGAGGHSLTEVEEILYRRSGLLGVSGISGDSRELLESDRPEAREALDLFTFRIAGEIARLAATLGGLDAIVFTAGIGENQPKIRADICLRLMWLGIDIDPAANDRNSAMITSPASRVSALVIPTDEEQVIADETVDILRKANR